MNQIIRRTLTAIFAIVFLIGFNVFFFASQNSAQYTRALWALMATCVSLTIVLVLNH